MTSLLALALVIYPQEKMMPTIAERLFDSGNAECELEESLKFEFDWLGWDHYDCSLEIRGVSPEYRLTESNLRVIKDAGFAKVYVNHTDHWETHYSFNRDTPPAPWRVSYPHKRGDKGSIWVEEFPSSWPAAQLESGYVEVKRPLVIYPHSNETGE